MKKIVVPCDFSKPAINAYRFALHLAAQSKGVVHLLHMIELPVLYDSVVMPALYMENELYKDMKESADKKFLKLTAKYFNKKVRVLANVKFGPVHPFITDYAREERADLIVMGTQGAGGMKEFFVGSNTEKVVRTSTVPVIAVKDNFKGLIKRIIFPTLLETEGQEDLMMKVKALQNFHKAHLHIVWINTPLNFSNDSDTNPRLEDFAKRFTLKNYSLHIYNYTDGEQGIIRFADDIGADMIAMGTHGRKGLAHLFRESLAENIVNHSKYLIWTSVLKKIKV